MWGWQVGVPKGQGGEAASQHSPVLQEASCKNHRVNRVVFLGSTKRLLTTGVSRWNTRQIALWDQVGAGTTAPSPWGPPLSTSIRTSGLIRHFFLLHRKTWPCP